METPVFSETNLNMADIGILSQNTIVLQVYDGTTEMSIITSLFVSPFSDPELDKQSSFDLHFLWYFFFHFYR